MLKSISIADQTLLEQLWAGFYPKKNTKAKVISFHYFKNPDGSIRWLYPSSNTFPIHLALYNASNLKAQFFKQINRLIYQFKLAFLLPKISFPNAHSFHQQMKKMAYNNYAIFTGTPGPNRKMIIALGGHQRCTHFLKIPLNDLSKKNVQNELETLQILSEQKTICQFDFPKAQKNDLGLLLENMNPAARWSSGTSWSDLHSLALLSLSNIQKKEANWQETSFYQKIKKHLAQLQSYQANKHPNYAKLAPLHQVLLKAFSRIKDNPKLLLHRAHIDFTPWNMFEGNNQLKIYDWELSQAEMPALFDFFHFIFQSEILVHQSKYEVISIKIKQYLQSTLLQKFIYQAKLNPSLYLHLYLLYNCSYYACLYMEQAEWHTQIHWLLQRWEQALSKDEVIFSF